MNVADLIAGAKSSVVTSEEGFGGADLIALDLVPDIQIGDLRALAAQIECPKALRPSEHSIWRSRWSAFSPLERAAWCVAALSDTLLLAHGKRAAGRAEEWPAAWTDDDRARVECLIYDSQVRAGYYQPDQPRFRPKDYGTFWSTHKNGPEWYEWMHNKRAAVHEDCMAAIQAAEVEVGRELCVMDVGCGTGAGYEKLLADRRFIGVDMGGPGIAWARKNRTNSRHSYLHEDVQAEGTAERLAALECDFVFCHGTIDCSWDMLDLIKALHTITKDRIYVSAVRGWFPELPAHRYFWKPAHTCFYNDISPRRLEREMLEIGFHDIEIAPLQAFNRADRPYETRITARRR